MIRSTTTADSPAYLVRRVRWPIFVAALLLGHATLMMVAVVWARTIPEAFAPVEDRAPRTVEAGGLPSPHQSETR